MNERVWAVIPARYGSSRFPGKPLHLIAGKPLLQWVIEGTQKAQLIQKVLVATDDLRIAKLAEKCGVQAVLTEANIPSGSDRIYKATENQQVDILINVQGDEPLVDGDLIDSLVQPLIQNPKLEMATLASAISQEDLQSENSVKVVLNQESDALYFSRFAIPYSRIPKVNPIEGVYKHIGMYGYRKNFLEKYCKCPPVSIEIAEGLEQLRALYMGARIRVILTRKHCIGVDTPEDIERVEKFLLKMRSV